MKQKFTKSAMQYEECCAQCHRKKRREENSKRGRPLIKTGQEFERGSRFGLYSEHLGNEVTPAASASVRWVPLFGAHSWGGSFSLGTAGKRRWQKAERRHSPYGLKRK